MIQKKLFLVTATLITTITPTILFAKGGGGEGAAVDARPAAVRESTFADEPATPNTETNAISTQAAAATITTPPRAKASFYAGLGIGMMNDKGYTGLTPKAYVGYGALIGKAKKFYGALEAFGGAGSIPLSPNQEYRVSSLIGISLIPGYMVNDWTLLFARLGAQSTRYTNIDSTKSSGVVGAGVQIYLTQHWDTRFEYDYANNKNLNQFNWDFIYKFK